jgi:hypothetical protein
MKAWLLLLCFLLPAPRALALGVDTSLLLEGEGRSLGASAFNPGNRIVQRPSRLGLLEGRVDATESLSFFRLRLKPRLQGEALRLNGESETYGSAFFQEAYLEARPAEDFSLLLGREQFGWGPAESITPSNWFAPEIQWEASPYYEQLGVYRGQASFSLGQNFSLIGMQELPPLPDHWASRDPVVPEAFRERSLLKAEWNWDNSNYVLGLTAGRDRLAAGRLWRAGAYGSWTVNDAWQFYVDEALREQTEEGAWKLLGVGGARYTFPGGAELRLEGIYDGEGLSRAERDSQAASLAAGSDLFLTRLLADKQDTLPGRGYVYSAFRWSNAAFLPSWLEAPTFSLRALRSLSDHSSSLLAGLEAGLSENLSASVYGALAAGPADGELKSVYTGLVGMAGKWSF